VEQEYGLERVDGARSERMPPAMPRINYLATSVYALLASILFGRRQTDLHSGMRASRKVLVKTLGCDPAGAVLPVDLLLRAIRKGLRVTSVFIPYRERIGQSTMRPLESARWTVKRIIGARLA